MLGSVILTPAVPVVNWVTTNGDAGYEEGTAATSSPVTTDSDADTIIGSFPSITLGVDESITLTGSILISGRTGAIPGNQIRWALFDAPGVPATGVGSGYVGVWATVSGVPSGSAIRTADGSTDNPFSGSATTEVSFASGPGGGILPDVSYAFSLTIKRVDDLNISVSASIADGAGLLYEWEPVETPASPATFTYDSVGILLGGTTDATKATLTDVEVVSGAGASAGVEITAINYDRTLGEITLTWKSVPGTTYAIDASETLESWPGDINDSLEGAADLGETSYSFPDLGLGNRYFFRVREVAD